MLSLAAAGCGAAGDPSAPTTPSTAGTPSPAAAGTGPRLAVARAAAPSVGGGTSATLRAVLAPATTGGDWLIAGTVEGPGGPTATVWSSADARTWQATSLPGADTRALAATRDGASTIVVGSEGPAASSRAAVWISSGAGLPFQSVGDLPAFAASAEPQAGGTRGTGAAAMDVVGAGTAGIFAAGAVSGRVAVWYSSDGRAWSRLAGAERVVDSAASPRLRSLLVTSNGVFAVGSVADGTERDGAVWSSPDGIHWSESNGGQGPFVGGGDHVLTAVAEDGTDLVAVGATRSGRSWQPASWVSPNGYVWTQPSADLPASSRPQGDTGGTVVRAVAATGTTGVVAVGGSVAAQRVWTSTDGRGWQELALPTGAADATDWAADLVAGDATTTVVADDQAGDPHVLVDSGGTWSEVRGPFGTPRPAVRVAGFARLGATTLAAVDETEPAGLVGQSTGTVVWLASGDGRSWRVTARGGVFAGATVTSVVAGGPGLLAGGHTVSSDGRAGGEAVVWSSADGRRWTRTPLRAGPGSAVGAVVVSAAGALAVGTTTVDGRSQATVWREGPSGWGAPAPLDATPTLADERVEGACASGSTVVVVGSSTREGLPTVGATAPASTTTSSATSTTVASRGSSAGFAGQADDGTVAAAWRSTDDGTAWTAASVSPQTGVGSQAAMSGCVVTGGTWVADGQAPDGSGPDVPAVWTSADGAAWTLAAATTLRVPGSTPLTGLDASGSTWVAVGGDPTPGAVTDPLDPPGEPALSGDAGPSSTGPDGGAGVWLATGSGASWFRQATTGPAWSAGGEVHADAVTRIGSTVVVGGSVDGALALWAGSVTGS